MLPAPPSASRRLSDEPAGPLFRPARLFWIVVSRLVFVGTGGIVGGPRALNAAPGIFCGPRFSGEAAGAARWGAFFRPMPRPPADAPGPPARGRAVRLGPLLAVTAACGIWGASFLMSKVALRELSAPHVVFWRFAVATPILAGMALRPGARALRRAWPLVVLAGALGVPLLFLLQLEGVAHTTATRAALVIGTIPPLTALAAALTLGERLTRRALVALGLSTVGLGVLVGWPGGAGTLLGDGLVLASAVVSVATILATRRLVERHDPVATAGTVLLVGVVLLVPAVLALAGPPPVPARPATWAALVGLGVGCTALANALWNVGLRGLGAARAALFVNLEPAFGVALGVGLLGEPLGAGVLVGGACILAAAVLAGRSA